jgi:hypothetical protein
MDLLARGVMRAMVANASLRRKHLPKPFAGSQG